MTDAELLDQITRMVQPPGNTAALDPIWRLINEHRRTQETPTERLTVHGYTVTAEQGLSQDERDGLTAYLSMLRKTQDRKRGIVNLDADPT